MSGQKPCFNLKTLELCGRCYCWHPYALCFVLSIVALPIFGFVVGILHFNDSCLNSSKFSFSNLGLNHWLTSFCFFLFCYELYFFSDLPAYWSNLYARLCREKIRIAFFYVFTFALTLWWGFGCYLYSTSSACKNDILGTASLIVLLTSSIEASFMACFCGATYFVRNIISNDHPSEREQDTDPLLANAYLVDGETTSDVGIRGRLHQMIAERDHITRLQEQASAGSHSSVTKQHTRVDVERNGGGRKAVARPPPSYHSATISVEHHDSGRRGKRGPGTPQTQKRQEQNVVDI